MTIRPKDIARSLVDSMVEHPTMSADSACDSALRLLKMKCPGTSFRQFAKLLERELKKRGKISAGLLVVPHEKSIAADSVGMLLKQKSGRTVLMERTVDPELIGGAVLLVDHRRIDCSIQGALAMLLRTCLQPLD